MSKSLNETIRKVTNSGALLFGLLGLAAFCVGLLLFVLDMRQVATSADESNRELRATLIARCEARVEYDKRFVLGAEGDVRFYGELLALADQLPMSTDDQTASVQRGQREAISDAIARKEAIVAEGVIENCEELDQ